MKAPSADPLDDGPLDLELKSDDPTDDVDVEERVVAAERQATYNTMLLCMLGSLNMLGLALLFDTLHDFDAAWFLSQVALFLLLFAVVFAFFWRAALPGSREEAIAEQLYDWIRGVVP